MIFVTVGTHEQQFDRLVKAVDELAKETGEEIFVQTGYCDYEPVHCKWSRFVPAGEMKAKFESADVVITHGGPSSFIEAMAVGKIPIVVPRRAEFEEHVNDHQVEFVEAVADRMGGIIACYDVEDLAHCVEQALAAGSAADYSSHNEEFCSDLKKLIESL